MNASKMLWIAYVVFVAAAVFVKTRGETGALTAGRAAIWAAWLAFLAYSLYCTSREDLFASIGAMGKLHWGRQVGLDLYIGLTLTTLLVYLNERSALIALVWLLPFFLFGNLATLVYVGLAYDELVSKLLR